MPTVTLQELDSKHPDVLLPPDNEFAEDYYVTVAAGRKAAKDLRVAFVAIARNAMPFIPRTLSTLERTASYFRESFFYVYENDSTDGTKDFLSEWATAGNRFCTLVENGRPHLNFTKAADRTHALAEYRNACRLWVSEKAPNADYVVVFDADPWGGVSGDGILHTIALMESSHRHAFGMAAYSWCEWGKPVWPTPTICHYDAWACRWNWWQERENMIWFHLWHPPIGSPPVKLNSAFGQLAVYRAADYLRGQYSGGDCEHVPFHKSIGGDFYLNPSMRVVSFWDLCESQ
jgi:hypothetical protein